MSKEFWDERFSGKEYVYGELPNQYLKEKLDGLLAGRILFPAEGEGRNAVYAAESGWDVYCFDQSSEGRKKALALADKKEVKINYQIMNGESPEYPDTFFDAIGLVFAHFPADKKSEIHKNLARKLKPGGWLILEAYNKNQIQIRESGQGVGGPREENVLLSLEELEEDFHNFEWMEAAEIVTELKEGDNHSGKAAVVRLFGRKKD